MYLDFRAIKGPRDRVRRVFPGASLSQGSGDQYTVVDMATLDLDVRTDGSKYRVVGRLDAILEFGCCRCLEPCRFGVGADIDVLYLPASDNTDDAEVGIEEADLSTAFYRDDQIDLAQLMHEQFQLALPMKPLCRDDCLGLCSVCGGNRNRTTCRCVARWVDPRFAPLKRLVTGRSSVHQGRSQRT